MEINTSLQKQREYVGVVDELIANQQQLSAERDDLLIAREKWQQDIYSLKHSHEEQVRHLHEFKERAEGNALLIQEAESRIVALGEDNELLLLQFQQVQVELESYHYRLSETERTLRKRELRVSALEASRSWRITAPLRALKRFYRRLLQ